MPFVTLEQIKPFLAEGLILALSKENFFEEIEKESSVFITNEIGIPIPDRVNDAPNYIKRPAAMIIQKFARPKIQSINSENFSAYEDMIDKEFDWAVNYLFNQKNTTINKLNDVGMINGVESW